MIFTQIFGGGDTQDFEHTSMYIYIHRGLSPNAIGTCSLLRSAALHSHAITVVMNNAPYSIS